MGTFDLKDNSLFTQKEASMEELVAKVGLLCDSTAKTGAWW